MKKVLFLMFLLLLMGLGAAGVKAQVRIGGAGAPNAAAVLDLNATDDATPAGNKGALALPRVSLASNTAQLNGTTPITGMLVYNTNTSMTNGTGIGMYFWDGTSWIRLSTGPDNSPDVMGVRITMDSVVNFAAFGTGAYSTVSAPGVLAWDYCRTNAGSLYCVLGNYNTVLVTGCMGQSGAAHTAARIVCYRPAALF